MRCWRCGTENTEGSTKCFYCGAEMERGVCETEEGKALRKLYDQFGAEAIFTQKNLLANGLGDYLQDSTKLRNQLRMAMDVGIGELYLEQLRDIGKPDAAFRQRVRKLIVDDAGLSDQLGEKIMGYFDEMIGWEKEEIEPKEPPKAPIQREVSQQAIKRDLEPFDTEQQRKFPKAIIWIIAALVILVGGLLIANQSQGWIPVPWATATPAPTAIPDPIAEADYNFSFAVRSINDDEYIRDIGKDTTDDKLGSNEYYTISLTVRNNTEVTLNATSVIIKLDDTPYTWRTLNLENGWEKIYRFDYSVMKSKINDGYHTFTYELDGKKVYSNRFVFYDTGCYVTDEYNAKGENTYHREVRKTVEYELAYAVHSISEDRYLRHVGNDTSVDELDKDEYYALYVTIHNNTGETIEYTTSTLKVDDIALSWAPFSVENGEGISLRFYYDQMQRLDVGKHTCILELNGKKVREWTFNVLTPTPKATPTPAPKVTPTPKSKATPTPTQVVTPTPEMFAGPVPKINSITPDEIYNGWLKIVCDNNGAYGPHFALLREHVQSGIVEAITFQDNDESGIKNLRRGLYDSNAVPGETYVYTLANTDNHGTYGVASEKYFYTVPLKEKPTGVSLDHANLPSLTRSQITEATKERYDNVKKLMSIDIREPEKSALTCIYAIYDPDGEAVGSWRSFVSHQSETAVHLGDFYQDTIWLGHDVPRLIDEHFYPKWHNQSEFGSIKTGEYTIKFYCDFGFIGTYHFTVLP